MQTPLRVAHHRSIWLPQTMTWLFNQIRFLPQEDIEADIVCDRTEHLDQFALPRIHSLHGRGNLALLTNRVRRRLRGLGSNTFMETVIRERDIRLLHSHFGPLGWADVPAARRTGVRHVVSFYGYDVNQVPRRKPAWRRRYASMFAEVDAVFCEGPHMKDCVAQLGCQPEKIHVQRLGIPLGTIPFRPCDWRSGEPLRVLLAASFREKKGLPVALKALARLARQIPIAVTIVGGAGPNPLDHQEERRILSIIEQDGLQPYVELRGFLTHDALMQEARRHHVFVSPSQTAADGDTEGGAPMTLVDMAASGVLLVSTRHCDIPQVVDHGATGLLSEEKDVEGLAANLAWLAEHPESWDGMRRAARRHVETSFDAATLGHQQARIYKDLMK